MSAKHRGICSILLLQRQRQLQRQLRRRLQQRLKRGQQSCNLNDNKVVVVLVVCILAIVVLIDVVIVAPRLFREAGNKYSLEEQFLFW